MEERVRFAPSPTGYLHVGGARTALFNWLYAKKTGGKFILRIEDTDLERSTEESVNAILEGMKWLGMDWDEGPFYQTKRMDLYKKYIKELLESGAAYRCYCTTEELNVMREQLKKEGKKPQYDGRCRNRTDFPEDKPFVIRLKIPEGSVTFNDLIKGPITVNNTEIDDFIIARSDGSPTYNLTVVVDDYLMGMTKIIRGDDHVNNTPKQILIYNALGWKVPDFAHVPMILGSDKTRLSKRHGATSVMAYQEMGYLSEAMINYLLRLSWSHGDKEIFSLAEMKELFTIDNIGRSPGVFNHDKLLWLNAHYIKEKNDEDLAELVFPFLRKIVSADNEIERESLIKLMPLLKERGKLLTEIAEMAQPYFIKAEEIIYDEKGFKKFVVAGKEYLEELIAEIENLETLNEETLTPIFKAILEKFSIKFLKIAQALRVSFTGKTFSPGIFEVMEFLGKEEVIKRVKRALSKI